MHRLAAGRSRVSSRYAPGLGLWPKLAAALPCASMSTSTVLRPARARPWASAMAVVVLPTPPFWLASV